MASPKSRISRARRDMRRAHNAIKKQSLSRCSNCGALTRPHCLCLSCGWYKGRQVVLSQE
ncbi:MAG: 50S ribosomal protein L32 [Oligoflexia bacterium]|nr:50S ribosomal protein L32 [Oligoflexia bacterium]